MSDLHRMTIPELERLAADIAVECARRAESNPSAIGYDLEVAAEFALKSKNWLSRAIEDCKAQGVA